MDAESAMLNGIESRNDRGDETCYKRQKNKRHTPSRSLQMLV